MPGPGRGRWGPGRPGRGGWGPGLGPAFRPGPIIRPIGRGLGVVGAVATGVVIAATVPPRRRRYPPPRAGHIYVVHDGTPRTVKVEDAPFIIRRIDVPAAAQGTQGEVIYQIEVGSAEFCTFCKLYACKKQINAARLVYSSCAVVPMFSLSTVVLWDWASVVNPPRRRGGLGSTIIWCTVGCFERSKSDSIVSLFCN